MVSFALAQLSFLDQTRIIMQDLEHSDEENRYYCIGKVTDAILTVKFTYRKNKIRIIGAGYSRKGKKIYERKIKYMNEPMDKEKAVSDSLPSPKELALKDETVKVTIALSKTSVDFFKNEAKKYNTQYQKMIRRLLDEYTAQQ